jgi:hypothetical protein
MRWLEAKRAALRTDAMILAALINRRTQELADLKRKALGELVRMCRPPCSRFVPVGESALLPAGMWRHG